MSQPIAPPTRRPIGVHVYHLVVWVAVAIAALAVVTSPVARLPHFDKPATDLIQTKYALELKEAAENFDDNDAYADSAPKQMVANGWHTNEQLTILARQNESALQLAQTLVNLEEKSITDQAAVALTQVTQSQRMFWLAAVLALGVVAHMAGSALFALIGRRPATCGPVTNVTTIPSVASATSLGSTTSAPSQAPQDWAPPQPPTFQPPNPTQRTL